MTCPDELRWVHDLAARLGSDRYARYVGRPGLKYAEVAEPVTPDVIDMHLRNEQAVALPALSLPDENKGHAIVFDFDDHNGEITGDRMVRTVCEFSDLLKAAPHFIVQSSSGTGYHIWLVFEQPARKDVLRERALKTIEAFNKKHPDLVLKEGAKGLPQGQVEVFPKGRASGGGCMIALPCARQSMLVKAKQTPLGVWQLPHYGNEQALPLIKPKKPGRKPANGDGAQPDPEAAFVALVSDRDPNDYDDWIQVAMRLIAAFGSDDSWAFERWVEWASTAARPDPRHDLEKKWHACSSTTLAPFTFWLDARDRGYSGKLPLSKKEERQQDVQRLLHGIELHRGDDGLAYAVVGPRRVVLVESEEFQDFLRLAAAEQGNIIKTDEVKELSALAAANARAKEPTSIALRFGREGERRFVFHADSACAVTEIDASGWRACAEPPILFRRGDGKPLAQPVPSSIEVFHEVLNIAPDSLVFLLAWMVNTIVMPGWQSPIAKVTGPHGAAKTSGMRAVVTSLDPKIGSFAGPPKTEEDLMVAANGSAIVSFDNASSLAQLSDALCRLSTGGGLRRRKLYTNHGVAALDVTRPVILTGIDPTVYNQDLIDRIIDVPLIRPEAYMSDEAFNALLDEAVPRMTGALFTLASQVLAMLPSVASIGRFRFDTFARIGECVARIMGKDEGWFAIEYEAQRREASQDAADGDCVLAFILFLCRTQHDDQNRLELNASALMDLMVQKVANREIFAARDDMPSNPRVLSSRVARIIPTLNDYGVRVTRGSHRAFIIEWDGADLSACDQFMLAQMPF